MSKQPSADDSGSVAAWALFVNALREAGERVLVQDRHATTLDRNEGLRFVSRLATLALEFFVENADPDHPELYDIMTATRKLAFDRPDARFRYAPVRPENDYRILGSRGGSCYLGLSIYAGTPGAGPRTLLDHLDGDGLVVGPDGSFEVMLSARACHENWLRLRPGARFLAVREYFMDRQRDQPASLRMERVGAGGLRTLTDERIDRGFREAATFVLDNLARWSEVATQLASSPNRLGQWHHRTDQRISIDHTNTYLVGSYSLQPAEALEIRFRAPMARYWGFNLANRWLESLDWRYHRVSINASTAVPEPDGSIRLLIAGRDPGVPNWLDTAGHWSGTMCLRWLFAEAPFVPAAAVILLDPPGT